MKTKYSLIALFIAGIVLIAGIITAGCNKEELKPASNLKTVYLSLSGSASCNPPSSANLRIGCVGSVSTMEIYCGSTGNISNSVRIATLSPNTYTYKVTGLKNSVAYYFWLKVRESGTNIWYTSAYTRVVVNCSGSSSSSSSSGAGSSSSSSSGG